MEKVRYEIDPHNRLVINRHGLKRIRRVLDGRFKAGRDNSLVYHVKSSLDRDADAPHQVKLRGSWSLSKYRTLVFTLDKWRRQTFGDRLALQADLLSAGKNSVTFAVTTKRPEGGETTYLLALGGSWQADEDNRLAFRIKRELGRSDMLMLEGAWEIGKDYEIIYRYERASLKRREKESHELVFKGQWDINRKGRIAYVLDADTDSAFDFRAGFGVFRDDYIKYEIGIGISGRARPVRRSITLFGSWRMVKNIGLSFEIERSGRRLYSIAFGAEARLTKDDTLSFNLKNLTDSADMGASLKLSHRMLKPDGDAFVEFLRSRGGESSVVAGAAWRW